MTRLEAFGVQCALLVVIVVFAGFLYSGAEIPKVNEQWLQRIFDIFLLILSPATFSAAIQNALNFKKETKDGEDSTKESITNPAA